jgi:CubicO group peptidase (beta-lactamase class C family)
MNHGLLLSLALVCVPCLAAPCVRANFPGRDWPVRSVGEGKAAQVAALEDYAFTLTGKDEDRAGLRTDALLIIKGGELIYERYARGWDASKRHISWSVAKSFTSALTGVAVAQGRLRLDDSICKTLPEARADVCRITVGNLLEFASGLDWQEEYEHGSYQNSSVISMLFGEGHSDMARFITDHRFYGEPGKVWRYSTGEATLLAKAATTALGADGAWSRFFDVLGMRDVILEEDVMGTPLGGSHLFATPRDYARFGYLYLHDGCWAGKRVLPEDWVRASIEPSASFIASAGADQSTPNGRMFWLNRTGGPVMTKPWADAPDDAYSAIGHWGQYVIVVPSAEVVIVRTGDDRNASVDLSKLISLSVEVAR